MANVKKCPNCGKEFVTKNCKCGYVSSSVDPKDPQPPPGSATTSGAGEAGPSPPPQPQPVGDPRGSGAGATGYSRSTGPAGPTGSEYRHSTATVTGRTQASPPGQTDDRGASASGRGADSPPPYHPTGSPDRNQPMPEGQWGSSRSASSTPHGSASHQRASDPDSPGPSRPLIARSRIGAGPSLLLTNTWLQGAALAAVLIIVAAGAAWGLWHL